MQQYKTYSVKEVAEKLGISTKTVYREIKAGNIKTLRLGPARRKIGIEEHALSLYLAGRFE